MPSLQSGARARHARSGTERRSAARMKAPPKEVNPGGRIVAPAEFDRLVTHFAENPRALVYLHLQRDSGWRPSDLMGLELAHVRLEDGVLLKVTQKARVIARAVLMPKTVDVLRGWLSQSHPARYVFEQPGIRPYHRTWPNELLRLAGL